MSKAVKVVERTLGRSMVACFSEEAIKTNGLHVNGFVWVCMSRTAVLVPNLKFPSQFQRASQQSLVFEIHPECPRMPQVALIPGTLNEAIHTNDIITTYHSPSNYSVYCSQLM